jgi:four helix bundle protein
MRDFRKLKVWERAHILTLRVYKITQNFPKEELYGLVSQMRRACSSIPTNLAEGCGRNSKAETIKFFNIAIGSASELEYQLILAFDLNYIDQEVYSQVSNELVEVRRMLYSFVQKLKADV